MVHFERRSGGLLHSDYFPELHDGEPLIPTEKKAWELADRFAKATKPTEIVNIYVVDDTFSPVDHYNDNIIRKY